MALLTINRKFFGNSEAFANGFLSLAALDSNSDGVIDQNDTAYADLVLWQDADVDGNTDAGELTTLVDAGVVSIDLGSISVDETNSGHTVSDRSTVTWVDGHSTVIEDIWFEVDQRKSDYILPDNFTYSAEAIVLPVLYGYGHIPSTWVALSQDAALVSESSSLVQQVNSGDIAGFLGNFEQFMLNWAGVADVDPSSRGSYIDGRHLAFLEEFYGTDFLQPGHGSNPGSANPNAKASVDLEAQFDELVEKFAARFMAQASDSGIILSVMNSGSLPTTASAVGFLSVLASTLDAQTNQLSGSNADIFTAVFDSVANGALNLENALVVIKLLKLDLDDGQGGYDADFSIAAQIYGDPAIAQTMLYLYQHSNDTSNMETGTDGADSISGSAANDLMFGLAGDDNLSSGSGNNVFFGGAGDDTMLGGTGDDKYIYRLGDGNDVITDLNSSQDQDTLALMNIELSDVVFSQNADRDLILTMPNGETVTIVNYFNSTSNEIEFIEFSDGTVLDTDAIMASLGTAGNDTFYSWGKSDTFVLRAGQGDDQIVSTSHNYGEVDTLRFEDGVTAADLYSVYVGNDLKIGFKASDGSITIVNDALDGSGASIYQMTYFVFSDGTTMSRQDFMNATLGTAGNDVFNGSGENDTFVLRAGQGDDQIVSTSHRS
ncbi:hypothetical protein LGT41_0002645 [Abyssibius alkaniclasticus]|uniref:calcium-binding protein n=1 Tax=Abyssibius alkaniclasticus TaxID=2881234 RepID=UPI0023640F05|nr:calcium-binding protein [Abyssibius alkaniclasticus]UPH71736.1 hypothetical protein LGT41_0002645 [Abyssibius alkaniclasticus]